ncbi:MAG: hypothetical protein B7W98_00720 [Parcubacteria group bacterium 20-58-5]|nr:MAG: hypothetical protein B7W98_00720 [Parcubacteria group bacterium 20-58-5]
MGNIAEETGREARITEMLDTYFADIGLAARERLRKIWNALSDDELERTHERLEAADGSD